MGGKIFYAGKSGGELHANSAIIAVLAKQWRNGMNLAKTTSQGSVLRCGGGGCTNGKNKHFKINNISLK
jgi:hypothetical protein